MQNKSFSETGGFLHVNASLSVLIFNLGESSLNQGFEFTDELELVSAGLGGVVVFVVEGKAQSLGLVPQLLVALELVGGGLGDGRLGTDALTELVNFVLESGSLGLKSGKVSFESFLLVVEGLDGFSIILGELVVGLLNLGSEGLDQLGDTLEGGVIDLLLAGGELGEGSEDGGVQLVTGGGGSDLDHLLGDAGELDEIGTTLVD